MLVSIFKYISSDPMSPASMDESTVVRDILYKPPVWYVTDGVSFYCVQSCVILVQNELHHVDDRHYYALPAVNRNILSCIIASPVYKHSYSHSLPRRFLLNVTVERDDILNLIHQQCLNCSVLYSKQNALH